MADFLIAANRTIDKFEGGFVNNPHDLGGRTRFGIAEASHPETGEAFFRDPSAEARPVAIKIYHEQYWQFDLVHSQDVANKLFDSCVLWGPVHAITLAQEAMYGIQVSGFGAPDGVFGPKTLAAINEANPEVFLVEYRAHLAFAHIERIVKNPSQLVFALGWMRRTCS